MLDRTYPGQFGYMLAQFKQNRQERYQRQYRAEEMYPETFDDAGETHGVFLHSLRGAFHFAQHGPVLHVKVIHCGTPAKYVMACEKRGPDLDQDPERGQLEETRHDTEKFIKGNLVGGRQGFLDHIVKLTVPVVYLYRQIDLVPNRP